MISFNLGDIHSAIIHFPIVLIFLTFVFDIFAGITKKENYQRIADWMLIMATLVIIPTALTGFLAKEFYPAGDPDVTRHQNMAITTAFFTLAYAIFRGSVLLNHKVHSVYLYVLLSLINVGLVSSTAELGGIVVRGKGIIFDSLREPGAVLPYGHVHQHNHEHKH